MSTICEVPEVGPVVLAVSNRAKHLRITVRPDRAVRLTIPRGVSLKRAQQFLNSRIPWIKKHVQRFEELELSHKQMPLPEISKARARVALIGRLEELAELHDFRFNKVSIRNQKTKWGSCSARNNISLNVNLARLPAELSDYVILHELVHTRIKNHSKEFWTELDAYVGGSAKKSSRILRTYRLGP
jgi:predicted metal-dependent hydrolase